MNLAPLFKAQKKLDEKILKEKGLEGQYLLDKKILALQVELGELANEWRGFKFWSENQEPNAGQTCPNCEGACHYLAYAGTSAEQEKNCDVCNGDGEINPLLEEYVDCLHFILSIGLELGTQSVIPSDYLHRTDNITKQFNYVFYTVMSIDERIVCNDYEDIEECYGYLFGGFIELGRQLGFTQEQIEQAYYEKNKINHERQESGY